MVRKLLAVCLAGYIVAAAVWVVSAGVVRNTGEVELLNVACDPTRELWADINARFVADHQAKTGETVRVKQSHGGSGSQARSVIDGLDADVITLALWTDTDAVRKAGRIAPGWEDRLPNRSLPYTSTIVFVVRKGNPKGITDWPDLLKPGVQVISPSPKTSGNGKWSFLALWGSVTTQGRSEAEAERFVGEVFRRVPTLDTSARAATMTFADKRIGDVHLTWENEAYLEAADPRYALEVVHPPVSVLAEPHVALVDAVADDKGTRAAAEAYLKYLYTEPAQEIIAHHYYRPTVESVRRRTADRFPKIELFPARRLGPDWDAIQRRFFAEGGVFDRIYAAGRGG